MTCAICKSVEASGRIAASAEVAGITFERKEAMSIAATCMLFVVMRSVATGATIESCDVHSRAMVMLGEPGSPFA